MHENKNTTPAQPDPAEAFANAEESIYSITEMSEFAETCLKLGLDPIKSVDTPAYWDLVSDFAFEQSEAKRGDEERDLNLDLLQLVSMTPSFIHSQQALDTHNYDSPNQRRELKQRVSYYNSFLRYVGGNYPNLSVSETSQALANVCGMARVDGIDTGNLLRSVIRGAQHELAFGQMLAHSGHKFERATLEQDLMGIDYIVYTENDHLPVDVKASLSEVEALGGKDSAFAIKQPKGSRTSGEPIIVMYSLTRDKEFQDHFLLPDNVAESKAYKLDELLHQAEEQRNVA